MKHSGIAVYFFVSIIFCSNASAQGQNSGVSSAANLRTAFKSIVHGRWVEMSYIENIAKTKSPYKSKDALAPIVEMNIDTNLIKGDLIEVGAPGIHRWFTFRLFFRQGRTQTSIPTDIKDPKVETNFTELGYDVKGLDTSLQLFYYNIDGKLLRKLSYVKVPTSAGGAFQYMVNKTLFAGTYSMTDAKGQSVTVEFTSEGEVKGFFDFKGYYALTDFVLKPVDNLDGICFQVQTESTKCYAYVINGDTLSLYQAIESNDRKMQLGALICKLVRH